MKVEVYVYSYVYIDYFCKYKETINCHTVEKEN